MPYFSRLTDIVTCNLSDLLEQSDDKAKTLEEVVAEMDLGLQASERSVKTARSNVASIERDIDQHETDAQAWVAEAKEKLQAGDEPGARAALLRKREIEHLVNGLRQQLEAAKSTRDQLTTTYRALHARMSDAQRRLAEISGTPVPEAAAELPVQPGDDDIDAELAELRAGLS